MEQTTLADIRVSTSHANPSTCDSTAQPRHWNSDWAHFVLLRKTEDKNGIPVARRPVIGRPENCGAPEGSAKYLWAAKYWEGTSYTWEEAVGIVSGELSFPFMASTPKDFGFVPHLNDTVVIDCDVKEYYDSPDGSPFVTPEGKANTAKLANTIIKRGIDDLKLLVESLGHDMTELATYTVLTKSGGLHLYFHNNCDVPLTQTTHHRMEWRNDVIASPNNWVAAPPTPGYTVVRDYPVATMPDWLAEALLTVNERFEPLGGKKSVAIDKRVRELRNQIFSGNRAIDNPDGATLTTWTAFLLQRIRHADQTGGWNTTIYQVTKDLARAGWDYDSIEQSVLASANPWDERQRRNAIATIKSGWNNLLRTSGR